MAVQHTEKSLVETALSSARDAAFVISIFLIFAGVVYRQRFFSSFDMPPSLSESSLYLILLDAYGVLEAHWTGVVVMMLLAVLVVVGVGLYLRQSKLPAATSHGFLAAIGIIFIIAAFPALAHIAEDSANHQSALVRGRFLIGSKIHIKADRTKGLPVTALLDSTALTLLGRTDKDFIALYQPSPTKLHPNVFPDAEVYTIPRDAVEYIESDLVASVGAQK